MAAAEPMGVSVSERTWAERGRPAPCCLGRWGRERRAPARRAGTSRPLYGINIAWSEAEGKIISERPWQPSGGRTAWWSRAGWSVATAEVRGGAQGDGRTQKA